MAISMQRLHFNKINEVDKKRLLVQIYQKVFRVIWCGIDFDKFCDLFFKDHHSSSQLFIFRSQNEVIGYLLNRTVDCKIDSKAYGVVRLTANILPQYLGHHLLTRIVFTEASRYFLRCLFTLRTFVFFSTCNTPSSYSAFYKRLLKVYPSPTTNSSQSIHKLLKRLKSFFAVETINENPFVVEYPYVSIPKDIASQLNYKQDISTQFYLSMCPEFDKGQALVTLVPLGLYSGLMEIAHQLIRPLIKTWQRGNQSIIEPKT